MLPGLESPSLKLYYILLFHLNSFTKCIDHPVMHKLEVNNKLPFVCRNNGMFFSRCVHFQLLRKLNNIFCFAFIFENGFKDTHSHTHRGLDCLKEKSQHKQKLIELGSLCVEEFTGGFKQEVKRPKM